MNNEKVLVLYWVNVINNNILFILFKFKRLVTEHVIQYLKDVYWQPYKVQ